MSLKKATQSGLVYSTDGGRMCPACRKPMASCACASSTPTTRAASPGVRVSRENKGRAGKTVTLVRGLAMEAKALAELGRRLQTACGTGGTVKDGVIELQGDHGERVIAHLAQAGLPAKRSGG